MSSATIEVLLATHNSARFLADLLDSLLRQSHQHFQILISDDQSGDETLALIGSYRERYPDRIALLPPANERLGAAGNFGRLLEHASADHALLCDHDDVWHPDKIDICRREMRRLESLYPADTPLLLHTDLTVVDAGLKVIDESCFRFTGIDPTRNRLGNLLYSNVATGCASIINRALYRRAIPIPACASMHDHWLAQVAATLGAVHYIDRPTILYRQHGANLIGARKRGRPSLARSLRRVLLTGEQYRYYLSCSAQAGELLARYDGDMSPENRRAAAALANFWRTKRRHRFETLRQGAILPPGLMQKAALALAAVRAPRHAERLAQADANRRA